MKGLLKQLGKAKGSGPSLLHPQGDHAHEHFTYDDDDEAKKNAERLSWEDQLEFFEASLPSRCTVRAGWEPPAGADPHCAVVWVDPQAREWAYQASVPVQVNPNPNPVVAAAGVGQQQRERELPG